MGYEAEAVEEGKATSRYMIAVVESLGVVAVQRGRFGKTYALLVTSGLLLIG